MQEFDKRCFSIQVSGRMAEILVLALESDNQFSAYSFDQYYRPGIESLVARGLVSGDCDNGAMTLTEKGLALANLISEYIKSQEYSF